MSFLIERKGDNKMIDFAPGMRTIICDEEWRVKKLKQIPPYVGHTNGIIGFAFSDRKVMAVMLGAFSSLPYDFY